MQLQSIKILIIFKKYHFIKMKHSTILFIVFILFFSSCVSTKKYEELEANRSKIANQLADSKRNLKNTEKERNDYADRLKTTQDELNELKTSNADLQRRFNNLTTNFDEVNKRYNDLLVQNEQQILNASNDNRRLSEALAKKQQELEAEAKKLKELEESLNSSKTNLTEAQAQLDNASKVLFEREKRLNELETILKQQEDKTKALRETINKALRGFNSSDLTVEERNGKVYVSLSQNLLFASGSTTIDKKGISAIKKLAQVLNDNPDIDITIEGHTDNVPLRGRSGMKDNWDLSVIRSTSLVRELIKNDVDPTRITAAGRGEHFPVADNATRDGKAKNRRSEIILSPKLDELFDLIKD